MQPVQSFAKLRYPCIVLLCINPSWFIQLLCINLCLPGQGTHCHRGWATEAPALPASQPSWPCRRPVHASCQQGSAELSPCLPGDGCICWCSIPGPGAIEGWHPASQSSSTLDLAAQGPRPGRGRTQAGGTAGPRTRGANCARRS